MWYDSLLQSAVLCLLVHKMSEDVLVASALMPQAQSALRGARQARHILSTGSDSNVDAGRYSTWS